MSVTAPRPAKTCACNRDARSRIAALTPRRREVLRGIVAGFSNKVIAHQLGISRKTVELHRALLMRDLGAHHVADAVRIAIEASFMDAQPPPEPAR
jgi:two-component system response regulator FixJ